MTIPTVPEHLTLADLVVLRNAEVYSNEAGQYPPGMPAHLREYTSPDGGILKLLNQAIAQAEQIIELRNSLGWPDFKTMCQVGKELADAHARIAELERKPALYAIGGVERAPRARIHSGPVHITSTRPTEDEARALVAELREVWGDSDDWTVYACIPLDDRTETASTSKETR